MVDGLATAITARVAVQHIFRQARSKYACFDLNAYLVELDLVSSM